MSSPERRAAGHSREPPASGRCYPAGGPKLRGTRAPREPAMLPAMDPWTLVAVAMLVVWGVATFAFTAPGWVHALLTAGVFLLIWRRVVRDTPAPPEAARPRRPEDDPARFAPRG